MMVHNLADRVLDWFRGEHLLINLGRDDRIRLVRITQAYLDYLTVEFPHSQTTLTLDMVFEVVACTTRRVLIICGADTRCGAYWQWIDRKYLVDAFPSTWQGGDQ